MGRFRGNGSEVGAMKCKAVEEKPIEDVVLDKIRSEEAEAVDAEFKRALDEAEDVLVQSGVSEDIDAYDAPTVLRVLRQFTEEGDLVEDPEESAETIAVQRLEAEPAYVRLKAGHTNNVAKFWSVTVQVAIDVPCYKEEIVSAFKFASKTIEDRLVEEVKKATIRSEQMRGGRMGNGSEHPF